MINTYENQLSCIGNITTSQPISLNGKFQKLLLPRSGEYPETAFKNQTVGVAGYFD